MDPRTPADVTVPATAARCGKSDPVTAVIIGFKGLKANPAARTRPIRTAPEPRPAAARMAMPPEHAHDAVKRTGSDRSATRCGITGPAAMPAQKRLRARVAAVIGSSAS